MGFARSSAGAESAPAPEDSRTYATHVSRCRLKGTTTSRWAPFRFKTPTDTIHCRSAAGIGNGSWTTTRARRLSSFASSPMPPPSVNGIDPKRTPPSSTSASARDAGPGCRPLFPSSSIGGSHGRRNTAVPECSAPSRNGRRVRLRASASLCFVGKIRAGRSTARTLSRVTVLGAGKSCLALRSSRIHRTRAVGHGSGSESHQASTASGSGPWSAPATTRTGRGANP